MINYEKVYLCLAKHQEDLIRNALKMLIEANEIAGVNSRYATPAELDNVVYDLDKLIENNFDSITLKDSV